MLHDLVSNPGALSIEALLEAHAGRLAEAVEAAGVEAVLEATGLTDETIAAVADGDIEAVGALDLEDVAALHALADGAPHAGTIAAEARDELLFGMTTAVLNVDVVAGEVELDLDPKEVQGMLEGRHPMTLREYAALQRFVGSRAP